GPRPEGDWDKNWVVLENGELMILPRLRGYGQIRKIMYGKYEEDAKDLLDDIEKKTFPDGKLYWKYTGKKSFTRGDEWWLVYDDHEKPTIDHVAEGVASHWNRAGRFTDQGARRDFFSGYADPKKHLRILPASVNSSFGQKEPDYSFVVG